LSIPAPPDQHTADAFASSWTNLPAESVYTTAQFEDWFRPLCRSDVENQTVLELGCGNASLMSHMLTWHPKSLHGIDLGESVEAAKRVLSRSTTDNWSVERADLVTYEGTGYDVVYSIGVLHHLQDPRLGFQSVIRNVKTGGRFHCWVYAREGNAIVIWLVDPLRKITSRLPWWINKYLIATPLAAVLFLYAKLTCGDSMAWLSSHLPLFEYCRWIRRRGFAFFRHVVFDQLVTPQTTYLERGTIENWLRSDKRIEQTSTYVQMRNGNSWKFGGSICANADRCKTVE
jgi:SAM-dependent methyltransferase